MAYVLYVSGGIVFTCWVFLLAGTILFIGRAIEELSDSPTWKGIQTAWMKFSGQTRKT